MGERLDLVRHETAAALAGAPEDGGPRAGRQVAAWISACLGRPVTAKRGLDYLPRLEPSLQRPRTPGARSRSGPSTSIGVG